MTTILVVLGIGVVIGALYAIANKESPIAGALTGGLVAGNCLFQLLIPAIILLVSLWFLGKIFG
ncbi:MAG: hypothetical protein IIZ30_07415 [Sphingomonas sp.]|nr:hypothetical protein [Sphingomonas sp.]MBQ1479849.1 hypothetical protein [Sphingomonas sp.]